MSQRIFRTIRVVELVVCGFFVLLATSVLLAPHASKIAALFIYLFAAFGASMFEFRIRGVKKAMARVRRELEEIGKADLQTSTPVAERSASELQEEIASSPLIARMMARRSIRLFTRGSWNGQPIEFGTAIVVSRDWNVYVSYVLVESDRLPRPFRLMTKGAVTSLARASMQTMPTTLGDPDFDGAWVIDAEHELAMRVLDPELRDRLMELSRSKGWGGVASVEVARTGLVLRWPAEISASSAAYLRDLALALENKLLADAAAN